MIEMSIRLNSKFNLLFMLFCICIMIIKVQNINAETCSNMDNKNNICKSGNNLENNYYTFSVIRHGARNTSKFSDFNKKLFYGSSNNHLTLEGINQLKLLALYLKEKYNLQCVNNSIHFFSSSKIRAITSGESFISNICDDNSYLEIINPIKIIDGKIRKNDNINDNDIQLKRENNFPPIYKNDLKNSNFYPVKLQIVYENLYKSYKFTELAKNLNLFTETFFSYEYDAMHLCYNLFFDYFKELKLDDKICRNENCNIDILFTKLGKLSSLMNIIDYHHHYISKDLNDGECFVLMKKIHLDKHFISLFGKSLYSKQRIRDLGAKWYERMKLFFFNEKKTHFHEIYFGHEENLEAILIQLIDIEKLKIIINQIKSDSKKIIDFYQKFIFPFSSILTFQLNRQTVDFTQEIKIFINGRDFFEEYNDLIYNDFLDSSHRNLSFIFDFILNNDKE